MCDLLEMLPQAWYNGHGIEFGWIREGGAFGVFDRVSMAERIRSALGGDWSGICSDLLDRLSSAGMRTGLCSAAMAAMPGMGLGARLGDLAYAMALAADVEPGPRPSPSRDVDLALAPAYASCVDYYLKRVQGAYLGFLGDHAWLPGEGPGGAVMACMRDDAMHRMAFAGLRPYLPARVPDGFGAGGTYGLPVQGAALRRAVSQTGMSVRERTEACGTLLYELWSRRAGPCSASIAAWYFKAAFAGLDRGGPPESPALLLRVCAAGLARALGREADVGDHIHEVETLAEGLGQASGAGAFLEECGKAAP